MRFYAICTNWQSKNRFAELVEKNLDGIEEWELESSASSMDDEEFPLLVEVSDDEDVEEFFDKLSREETEAID